LSAGPDGTFVLSYDDTADTRSIQDGDGRLAIISPDGRRVDQLTPSALSPLMSRKPAFDGRGRVYFATATRDAKFATYQLFAGTGKAAPVPTGPIPGGAGPALAPDVAVRADGRQLFTYGIGYTSGCTQYGEVWASQDLDGGETQADKLASVSFGGARDPVSGDCGAAHGRVLMASQACIDAQGAATVFVIELDADAGNYVITSVHRPVNGVWGPRETVATLPRDGGFPLGFWLAGSTPAFGYLREDGDAYVLCWTERNADGTWQAPRTIARSGSLSGIGVAPLTDGDALVVWSEEGGAKRMLARRVLSDAPVVLASGLADAPELASSAVAVAADGSGNAIAAVADGDKTRYIGYDDAGPVLDGVSIPSSSAPGEARTYSLGSARDVWSAVRTPAWAFSDGGGAAGNVAAHAFGAPGRYSASVSVTDAVGNTTTVSGPVDVPSPVVLRDTFPPKLTKRPAVRAGVLAFSVSEAGKAVATVTRSAKGVRKGSRCVAPPRRKAKARSCTRQVKVATVRATLKAGPAKLKLPARVRRTKGAYTIVLTLTDAAGNTTTTKTTFRVK
jgi:hypothetical protein